MIGEQLPREELERGWRQLVEDLAEGRKPILETLKSAKPAIYQDGDYQGFVTYCRSFHALLQDVRIQKRLHKEISEKILELDGDYKVSDIDDGIRSKDGFRLMSKLNAVHVEMFGDSPSLLTGATFEECLNDYRRLMKHVENLWGDACELYRRDHYPLCTFLSILVVEEIGKLGRLWYDLLGWDHPKGDAQKGLGVLGRDHRKKHFIAVVSGAVINSRLDRILGVKQIKRLLQDAESGKLERLRQSCLYIDLVDGKIATPDSIVGQDVAKLFVVLAGELWAEILGHVPWEFEAMIGKVTKFEIEIGIAGDLVRRE